MSDRFRWILSVRRVILVGLVCGAALGVAPVAFAQFVESALDQTPSIDGHVYQGWSELYTVFAPNPYPHDQAGAVVQTYNMNFTVPPGWMGVAAHKFKNGQICGNTGYIYNNDYSHQQYAETSSLCGSGAYYSQGVIALWNGNGYDYYYLSPTTTLNG